MAQKHEAFINARKGKLAEVVLTNGKSLFLNVVFCDQFSLIGEQPGPGTEVVVFKHAISHIVFTRETEQHPAEAEEEVAAAVQENAGVTETPEASDDDFFL